MTGFSRGLEKLMGYPCSVLHPDASRAHTLFQVLRPNAYSAYSARRQGPSQWHRRERAPAPRGMSHCKSSNRQEGRGRSGTGFRSLPCSGPQQKRHSCCRLSFSCCTIAPPALTICAGIPCQPLSCQQNQCHAYSSWTQLIASLPPRMMVLLLSAMTGEKRMLDQCCAGQHLKRLSAPHTRPAPC